MLDMKILMSWILENLFFGFLMLDNVDETCLPSVSAGGTAFRVRELVLISVFQPVDHAYPGLIWFPLEVLVYPLMLQSLKHSLR